MGFDEYKSASDIFDECIGTVQEETIDDMFDFDSLSDDPDESTLDDHGAVVYYNPVNFKFRVASTHSCLNPENLKTWRCIIIGVVLRTYGDDTYDVLMSGFLMATPLWLPAMYRQQGKRKYIRKYAKEMFKRYVSAFFKQCPAYEDLLNLEITMPEVSELRMIHDNPDFFHNLEQCTDTKNMLDFKKRLYENHIYATHNNRIYMMKISDNPDKEPEIIIPDTYPGDFLCVFRHVNKSLAETLVSSTDNDIYFNDEEN